jgi:hypothetical protein
MDAPMGVTVTLKLLLFCREKSDNIVSDLAAAAFAAAAASAAAALLEMQKHLLLHAVLF